MDFEELQKHIDKIMNERNSQPVPEFEGYSPDDMHHLLHFPFQSKSPVQLQKMSPKEYAKVPMLNQVKYFLDLIREEGELKLTDSGYLSPKIVQDIYAQGYLTEALFEAGLYKVYLEKDAKTVNLTRLLCELAGLTKKRKGKLSLTKTAEKVIDHDHKLLELIFRTHSEEFNWGYYDGYGNHPVGQLGMGFSLILLHKYGHKKRPAEFYAKKYFKAFPQLLEHEVTNPVTDRERHFHRCYSLRTFGRFLDYYGLIDLEVSDAILRRDETLAKSPLFDEFIEVVPAGKGGHNRVRCGKTEWLGLGWW